MSLVAQLYGISAYEAMKLSQLAVNFMMESAEVAILHQAVSSNEMKALVRARLEPTLREVRAARDARADMVGAGGAGGAIGAPPKEG